MMTKGPEYPKVSFLVPRPTLAKVDAFAKVNAMSLSEAMRFVIDAGLETLATAGMLESKIPPHDAERPLPTRGTFPRPTGGQHGSTTKQE